MNGTAITRTVVTGEGPLSMEEPVAQLDLMADQQQVGSVAEAVAVMEPVVVAAIPVAEAVLIVVTVLAMAEAVDLTIHARTRLTLQATTRAMVRS